MVGLAGRFTYIGGKWWTFGGASEQSREGKAAYLQRKKPSMSTQAVSSASHCVTSRRSKRRKRALLNNAFKLHLRYVRSAI